MKLEAPQPLAGESKDEKKLYPSQTSEPPLQSPPGAKTGPETKSHSPPALPVGIPQFTMVKEQVANGLRPALDEGLDWLQANGYRTVLFLRKPGDSDGPDRKQAEKRGLKFLSLEVAPQTLARKHLDEFQAVVGDKAGHPLFIYDREGDLAGGMWFLYFRLGEQLEDDAARVRADSLGFRAHREVAHRAMWQAVQKLIGPGT